MKIFLLTHERELHRATNTGALALEDANEIVERILWERVNPNKDLVRIIENNEAVLLYSKGDSSPALSSEIIPTTETLSAVLKLLSPTSIEEYENIIIIDSTWQEAQKIFNHSPYLKNAPQFTLKTTNDSLYKLRANQPKGGLCTIECIIEVLRLKGQEKMAAELSLKFAQFNG
ncbi:tRNA-uridine aminocarboxypropyltransferase [Colwellia psychrerythraea]|uniref:tRNA-uridine aminocarboxypropyltransferase n=1 Tax=Colwellia psychrerythraea TaxID=28229 RepID=A0A099L163_COLPS|nr:tRNA-uridine aminocarboxypropyltransferase [Colwellia psychrerythraea]KGJ95882.1 DTW domain containing protein [Colwellia psychrerythraea]